jgi:hypothetical protein
MLVFHSTIHFPSFQDSIEFKATVFVDWRKCVQVDMATAKGGGRVHRP